MWCPVYGYFSCRKHNLWRAFVDGVIDKDEKVVCSKGDNQFKIRLECINHTLFMTKMTKINTLFISKTVEKLPFGAAHI